jgi:RecA/RadA recombinase
MAKKVTEIKEKKRFSFEAFDKQLSKIPGFELGSIIENNTFSEVDEWIPTGNYLLNATISGSLFGGIPNSRAIGLVGDPETGKTFLCLNIAREAQQAGYDIIYCETEGAVDRSSVTKLGVDPKRLRYQPIKTVNDFKRFTVQVIDMVRKARAAGENPKIMLFLDSLGMLNTEKEINDAMAGKDAMDMGIKAKQLRSLFRLITLDLTANKIPLVVTNHTTIGNIGSYSGPTKESAGGDGPIFSLSTALLLSKKFQVDDANKSVKTGIIIQLRPKKSRSTIPTTITIHVGFVGGMNPYVGLEDYLTWDACGIGKGKIMTAKEYAKSGDKTGDAFVHTYEEVDEKTGEIKTISEDLVYVRNDNARWCVKHLGKSLSKGSLLFNKEVLTIDVLKQLDVNVIQPAFKLPEHAISIEEEFEEEFEEGAED